MGVDWSLARGGRNGGFENALAMGLQFGTMAADARDKREMQDTLGRLQANPDDAEAQAFVFQRNPELAAKISEFQDRRAFRSALSDYIGNSGLAGQTGQRNVLLSMPQAGPAPQADANALARPLPPVQPGASFEDAFAPLGPSAGPDMAQNGPQTAPQAQRDAAATPDLTSVLGKPQSARDAAFLRMVQIDPEKALKIDSDMRNSFVDRLKAESDFYGLAVQELGQMTDEAGWQAALHRLAPMAQALGADLMAVVPPSYPGPDAVKGLLERAMPVKDRLDYMLRAANVDADNARADRNTDSLIETRDGRLEETRRYNDRRIATTRRGQDLTDTRVRSGRGGRSRDNGSGLNDLPEVSTPAEASKLPSGTRFRIKGSNIVKVVP